MENKIDQFFKDKLDDHTLPPSDEAWAKVEANLSKKNNIVIWRIAAAILIAGALVSVIILSQQGVDKNQPAIAAKKSSKDNLIKEKPTQEISKVEKDTNSNSTQRSVSSLTSKKQSALKSSSPRFVSPQTESKSDQKEKQETKTWSVKTQTTEEVVEKDKSSFAKASEGKEKINTEATPPATIASTKRKPIKLEFTLEDFSTELPVAKVNEEKNSGFKKVWDLAIEVKNGDGRVHEIKNELFALSFKKNKNQ